MKQYGVAIIGCGLIGRKRVEALHSAKLVICADVALERAQQLASRGTNVAATAQWLDAVRHPDVDIVIVATTNDSLTPITIAALEAGKHVLVEKPVARSRTELETVMKAAAPARSLIRVGFNHRYHPALRKARELFEQGLLGELMFIRGRYGHGGRIGYDKEWRADPQLAGGGELIDQGVHLIDLSRWFLGDFSRIDGFATTYFWQMPVDDNAFLTLRTAGGQTAFLHVTCTEWKNLFSLEIYGRKAKLHVEGLGGSYGQERLTLYQMLPEMGPPETTMWEYRPTDVSWQLEFADFLQDVHLGRKPSAGLNDAYAALKVVEAIYKESHCDYYP
jgi:predicted dehydrogenase